MEAYSYNGGFEPFETYNRRKTYEKKELHMLGSRTGVCVCAYIILANLLPILLMSDRFLELYEKNGTFFYSYNILITLLTLFLPFFLMGRSTEKKLPVQVDMIPAGKPNRLSLLLLAVPAGFAGCLLANTINSYITLIIESAGVKLTAPDLEPATMTQNIPMYLLFVAVCSPLCEEIIMRGIVLQPLRKYSDAFAVGVSAVVFGLMHCNLIQAPFAVLGGIVLGFFAVSTGSLWTGILIHACNNLFAVFVEEIGKGLSDGEFAALYTLLMRVILLVGAVCLVFFCLIKRKVHTDRRDTVLTTGEKAKAFFLNIPMAAALIFVAIMTREYILL